MADSSRGYEFEARIYTLLTQLEKKHPTVVTLKRQEAIKLYNGDTVIPDFELRCDLGFEIEAHLIECQSRERSSSEIVHKIRHIKALSNRNRFLFVYENDSFLMPAQRSSLESDGINCYSFNEFETYIKRLELTLQGVTIASMLHQSNHEAKDKKRELPRKLSELHVLIGKARACNDPEELKALYDRIRDIQRRSFKDIGPDNPVLIA